ncbi:MAG: hypothetical protein JW807_05825 [Spirochaetes bacterium]|nr:hypothetical protein [Spirochaetota bacterium]
MKFFRSILTTKIIRLILALFIASPFLLQAGCNDEAGTSPKSLLALYNPIIYVDGSLNDAFDGSLEYSLTLYEPTQYSLTDGDNNQYLLSADDPVPNVNLQYSLTINDSPKDVYFIFTNTSPYSKSSYPAVTDPEQSIYQDIIPESGDGNTQTPVPGGAAGIRGKPEISEFNRNPFALLNSINPVTLLLSIVPPDRPLYDAEGSGSALRIDKYTTVNATCREVRTVETALGAKTLNIWVADNCWYSGGTTTNKINQDMVTDLADQFIKTDLNNDIYDWVSNIYGEEWGPLTDSSLSERDRNKLIDVTNEITILLYDIDNDNSQNGGVLGYFWAKDNFKKTAISYSNERIMFYLDAVLFATKSGGIWNITDKWPSDIVSTLAHEFQHMIHFYQKNVMRTGGEGTEIWIDEMCSLATEDLVAQLIEVNGPRGVDYDTATAGPDNNMNGRLPLFNYFNTFSVTSWYSGAGVLLGYSLNYALGSYLARNYGGAGFFQNVMHNDSTDYAAIEYALSGTGESFGTVLRKWGVTNILSDKTDTPETFRYNINDWATSTISGIDYDLGSINLYNYRYWYEGSYYDGPVIQTSIPSETMPPASNFYYLAAKNLIGTKSWVIPMRSNVRLSVVARDQLPVSVP